MKTLNGVPIEIFRAGDYGAKGKYTTADLDRIVAGYDPAKHEAPVVLGHPENDSPAFGWVESIARQGDVLVAKLKQVPAAFEDVVRAGTFKKRSASFYRSPAGELGLRHVGFLGAMPPEVKGLADVTLGECKFGEAEFQTIEFNEEKRMTVEEMKQALAEAFGKLFGDKKPSTFSEEDVKRIAAEAVTAATAPLQTKLTTLETEFTESKKTAVAAGVSGLASAAIQKLKDAGKWVPAFDKMGAPQIFAELAKSEATVTFGEGDKAVTRPMVEVFGEFLGGIKQIVPAGELVAAAAAAKKGNVLAFNETTRIKVDPASLALNDAAEKIAKDKNISFGEALRIARAEGHGEVAQQGGAAAGAV